jgi:hypothetical protein
LSDFLVSSFLVLAQAFFVSNKTFTFLEGKAFNIFSKSVFEAQSKTLCFPSAASTFRSFNHSNIFLSFASIFFLASYQYFLILVLTSNCSKTDTIE